MSNFAMRHSAERSLVRYLDGELAPRKVRKLERHLETCGQCRGELEELKNTLAECVRYRQDVLAAQFPRRRNRGAICTATFTGLMSLWPMSLSLYG